jgi:SAM-dependent methyltransferase
MCNIACIEFGKSYLKEDEIKGKKILEVGALDINGSLKKDVEIFGPAEYIGVDIQNGPGVDKICRAEDLTKEFGEEFFDVLLATELLEHVKYWRDAINNFKRVLKPGGIIIITTRSPGYSYHDYPYDYWRYAEEDMKNIFEDFDIEALEKDPMSPGIFLKAKKPSGFKEKDISGYALYSILKGKPVKKISDFEISVLTALFSLKRSVWKFLPARIKGVVEKRK